MQKWHKTAHFLPDPRTSLLRNLISCISWQHLSSWWSMSWTQNTRDCWLLEQLAFFTNHCLPSGGMQWPSLVLSVSPLPVICFLYGVEENHGKPVMVFAKVTMGLRGSPFPYTETSPSKRNWMKWSKTFSQCFSSLLLTVVSARFNHESKHSSLFQYHHSEDIEYSLSLPTPGMTLTKLEY